MLEAMTYQDMLSDINKNARKNGIINDTIGILITRPDLPTGKQIIFIFEQENLLIFIYPVMVRTGQNMIILMG